jgi:hypothetical protein
MSASTWKATKNITHVSTFYLVANINKFIDSAANPPVIYKNPAKNATPYPSNSSGLVFKYKIKLIPYLISSISKKCISTQVMYLVINTSTEGVLI